MSTKQSTPSIQCSPTNLIQFPSEQSGKRGFIVNHKTGRRWPYGAGMSLAPTGTPTVAQRGLQTQAEERKANNERVKRDYRLT